MEVELVMTSREKVVFKKKKQVDLGMVRKDENKSTECISVSIIEFGVQRYVHKK